MASTGRRRQQCKVGQTTMFFVVNVSVCGVVISKCKIGDLDVIVRFQYIQ